MGLAFLTLSCRSLGDLNFTAQEAPTPTPVSLPHSTFVPSETAAQVLVGVPLPLETHHLTALANRLERLEIFVNGQPVRTEATSGQVTFPPELATIEIVTRNDPERANLAEVVPFLPPTCREVLHIGNGPVLDSPLSSFPSSDWNVCYVWIGCVPGTYDLSMVAIDRAGNRSEVIAQRIEVIDQASERLSRNRERCQL
jgi:hypothetical protein